MKRIVVSEYTKEVRYQVGKEEMEKMVCCLISLYKHIDGRYVFVGMVYTDDIKEAKWDGDAIESINGVTFALNVYPMISESVYKYFMENEDK